MPSQFLRPGDRIIMEAADLQGLLDALREQGYLVLGPTIRDNTIIHDILRSATDLPIGWTEDQEKASYRIKRWKDRAFFGFTLGPHSWKRFLLPSEFRLWQASRKEAVVDVIPDDETPSRMAFIGVRSCDLHAIRILDRVFLNDEKDGSNPQWERQSFVDASYERRRQGTFIVAVQCTRAGGTCFCASMNTGPRATFGFDIALTEFLSAPSHHFFVEIGTQTGADMLAAVTHRKATVDEIAVVDHILEKTAAQMGRTLDTTEIKELLYRSYEHPRWQSTARRCFTCGNCTMVCPTCFCTTIEDSTDLTGAEAQRIRRWDSCFTLDFSYVHGGHVRRSPNARYRHWLIHKLATWMDQFGTSGCVGCGRCITWCPAAIDITEEVLAIRNTKGIEVAKEKCHAHL